MCQYRTLRLAGGAGGVYQRGYILGGGGGTTFGNHTAHFIVRGRADRRQVRPGERTYTCAIGVRRKGAVDKHDTPQCRASVGDGTHGIIVTLRADNDYGGFAVVQDILYLFG